MKEYSFETWFQNRKTSDVSITSDRAVVTYTINPLIQNVIELPFGFREDITLEDVYRFLESRCMPKGRKDQMQEYLISLRLEEYNPWEIVKKTHGVMWEDFLWLRFPEENLTWEDVKIRD